MKHHEVFPGQAKALSYLRWPYRLYQALAHLLAPILITLFLIRSRREPLYRAHLGQRFGALPRAAQNSVWVFAASLGETRAASPLIRLLLEQGHTVVLSHSSPAGLTEGQRLFEDQIAAGEVVQSYMPIDLFWCVRRAIKRINPAVCLVVESELWPALAKECARADVPMAQINGCLSRRSVHRDKHGLGRYRLAVLQTYVKVLTKSERYAQIYRDAGVTAERIAQVGELKFDLPVNNTQKDAAHLLKTGLPDDRPIFLIASSVADEEEELDHIVANLLALTPRPLILWVPRSPQRFDAVEDRLQKAGHTTLRRSTSLNADLSGTIPHDCEVLVGDSIGEMAFFYELADLVFVGASLNDDGGHNIVEPLAQARPVIMGPSIYGIDFPAREAQEAGAFESLPDGKAVLARAAELLTDHPTLAIMSDKAQTFHKSHVGAAERSLRELAPYMPKVTPPA